MSKRRPDDDRISWAIVHNLDPQTEPWTALADRLAVDRAYLYGRAKYIQRMGGWMCPLSRKFCTMCGKPLLCNAETGNQSMHHWCKRQRDNERLAGKGAEWAAIVQARTTVNAINAKGRWVEADNAYLIAHHTDAAEDLASALGRSLYAVNTRIARLRQQGRIPDDASRRSASAKRRPMHMGPAIRPHRSPRKLAARTLAILRDLDAGLPHIDIARTHGVSTQRVSQIKYRHRLNEQNGQ